MSRVKIEYRFRGDEIYAKEILIADPVKPKTERNNEIIELIEKYKWGQKEVGIFFNISSARVHQIYHKYLKRKMKNVRR